MTVGEFMDMYSNKVSVSHSSNVEGGLWLRIEGSDKPGGMANNHGAAHLSVPDAQVLIALLEKGIKEQESEEG